ncbi:HSP70-17, partial [Symbiodinium sp. KB8]
PLTVTLADTPDFTRAMNSSEMEASAAVLAELQAIDDAKAKREAAKSSLESYIYASRGQMGELYEEVEAVSTEEQREAISTALEETEDWLYDEGDNTSLDKYLSKDAELKALVQPVLERVKEAAERPAAIKSARKFIVSTEASLADWNETRPWLTDYQLQRAADALKVFTEWLEEKVAAQEAKEAHEEPAFTVAQLKGQRQPVKLQMNMLKR